MTEQQSCILVSTRDNWWVRPAMWFSAGIITGLLIHGLPAFALLVAAVSVLLNFDIEYERRKV